MENENTNIEIKENIFNILKKYEDDKNKHKIDKLNVILVGRKNIGKTDLVYYMLKKDPEINHNNNLNRDYSEYTSEKVPILKLIEYKGIGFNKDSNPEKICKQIYEFINKIKKINPIHCIWYCISSTKFESPEIAVLNKLKRSYGDDNILPVIVVYTQIDDEDITEQMKAHIEKQNIKTNFIKTLAKNIKLNRTNEIKHAYGDEELLAATLEKCKNALQSDLIKVMLENISESVKNELITKNKNIK